MLSVVFHSKQGHILLCYCAFIHTMSYANEADNVLCEKIHCVGSATVGDLQNLTMSLQYSQSALLSYVLQRQSLEIITIDSLNLKNCLLIQIKITI